MEHLNYPSSLDPEVIARSFLAGNGELGVLPQDVTAFVETCMQEGIALLGWELWLADYGFSLSGLAPAVGSWDGLIPCKGDDRPAVVGGEVRRLPGEDWAPYVDRSAEETLAQIDRFSLGDVEDKYVSHVRYNFTLSRRDPDELPTSDGGVSTLASPSRPPS